MLSLIALKSYLVAVKVASTSNLVTYFQCEAGIIEPMLEHWIRKGCVMRRYKTSNCGVTCHACKPKAVEFYEWVAPLEGG